MSTTQALLTKNLLIWEKFKFFPSLPYLWHIQFIWYFRYFDYIAVLPNSLYLVTNITDQENNCYLNSSLPGNLWYLSIIMHHAYSPTYMSLFYPNPQGGCDGQFFPLRLHTSTIVHSNLDLTELFTLWWIFFCSIFCAHFGRIFVSPFLHVLYIYGLFLWY